MSLRAIGYRLLAAILLLPLSACHPWDHPVSEDDDNRLTRTVLIYMVAENSLSNGSFQEQDFEEIVHSVGEIPDKCQLLIYMDDTEFPRLYVVDKSQPTGMRELLHWKTDFDSCDPGTLKEIMNAVVTLYPSKGYGLVFWSHGNAWMPAQRAENPRRTIGIDNGRNRQDNSGSKMEISQLREALSPFPKLDYLMFDACFMQTIEVAWELRNVAHYIIASPAEIPNPGAPYHHIIPPMFTKQADVEGIIDEYFRFYADSAVYIREGYSYTHGAVLSVVDCTQLEALQTSTEKMIKRYGSADEDRRLTGVLRYFPLSSQVIPEFYDMKGYMRHLITSPTDWSEWFAAFDAAVPYRRATEHWFTSYTGSYMYIRDKEDFGGISMFVPQPQDYFGTLLNQFRATSWYPVSGWSAFY